MGFPDKNIATASIFRRHTKITWGILQFEELYKHSTEEKFSFLTVISHNSLKGKLLIRKNWNINLKIN